jgi:hypothetical protein
VDPCAGRTWRRHGTFGAAAADGRRRAETRSTRLQHRTPAVGFVSLARTGRRSTPCPRSAEVAAAPTTFGAAAADGRRRAETRSTRSAGRKAGFLSGGDNLVVETRVAITGRTDEEKAVWKSIGDGNEDGVEWIVLCADPTKFDSLRRDEMTSVGKVEHGPVRGIRVRFRTSMLADARVQSSEPGVQAAPAESRPASIRPAAVPDCRSGVSASSGLDSPRSGCAILPSRRPGPSHGRDWSTLRRTSMLADARVQSSEPGVQAAPAESRPASIRPAEFDSLRRDEMTSVGKVEHGPVRGIRVRFRDLEQRLVGGYTRPAFRYVVRALRSEERVC